MHHVSHSKRFEGFKSLKIVAQRAVSNPEPHAEYDPLEPNRRAIKARVDRLRDPCSRVLDKRAEENGMLSNEGECSIWFKVKVVTARAMRITHLLQQPRSQQRQPHGTGTVG